MREEKEEGGWAGVGRACLRGFGLDRRAVAPPCRLRAQSSPLVGRPRLSDEPKPSPGTSPQASLQSCQQPRLCDSLFLVLLFSEASIQMFFSTDASCISPMLKRCSK